MAPRGPLPTGTYWRRRLFVGVLVVSIVFVIARWLTAGGDGADDDVSAEQAAARVQATETVTVGDQGAKTEPTGAATDAPTDAATGPSASASASPTLAAPQGPCAADDVLVTPTVAQGQDAGADVTLEISLQTAHAEACTWTVSSDTVVIKVSQGREQLWTTQECRRALPAQSVVVRRDVATVVPVTWDEAKESDAKCSGRTDWVPAGDYTIAAAAIGGEPASAEFALLTPSEAAAG